MYTGEKIKYFRNLRGLSQEELADGICHKSLICKIERNASIPDESTLQAIKRRLGIEAAISPAEIEALQGRIFDWYKLIKNRQIDEAVEIQNELRAAVNLSQDVDLDIFYTIFEIRLLLFSFTANKDAIENKIAYVSDMKPIFF